MVASIPDGLEFGRPPLGVVEDAEDLQIISPDAVGNQAWRVRDDQLPRARHASRPAQMGHLRQMALHHMDDSQHLVHGRRGIVPRMNSAMDSR